MLRLLLFCYYYYHYNITMLSGKRISTTPTFSDNPTIEVPTDIPLHLTSAKFPLTDSCTVYVAETRSNSTTATPGFFKPSSLSPSSLSYVPPPVTTTTPQQPTPLNLSTSFSEYSSSLTPPGQTFQLRIEKTFPVQRGLRPVTLM